jgi:primary-amine oxidase
MRRISQRRLRAFAAVILLFLGSGTAMALTNCTPTATANTFTCSMTNGARWEFTLESNAIKGLVLKNISLTPKLTAPKTRIIEEASLAQVLLTYDSGPSQGPQHLLKPDATPPIGLSLLPLSASDCPGNIIGSVICQMVLPRGYAWRGNLSGTAAGQIQGENIVIFGVSAAANNTYIQQWVFDDAGTIQPMLGVSGELDPAFDSGIATGWPISATTRYATNRFHTAYWRIDFALGDDPATATTNDLFQQLDYSPNTTGNIYTQAITNISTEGKFNLSPDAKRFWMVKDTLISHAANGQKIAFEMIPHNTSIHHGSTPFTNYEVYITQKKTCEQFASHNPTTSSCGADLPSFVNAEAINDPVAWVGTTWHQVPRAEDESDIQIHWQGVILAPRDLSATSPL